MYNMYGMTEEKVSLCEYWEDEEHEAPDLPEEIWACICEEVRLTEERDYVCEDNNRESLMNIALSSSVLCTDRSIFLAVSDCVSRCGRTSTAVSHYLRF